MRYECPDCGEEYYSKKLCEVFCGICAADNGRDVKMTAMTDPAPSVQPVRAWAVVDKDNNVKQVIFSNEPASTFLWEMAQPDRAPHRVIRVEIREVNDE